MYLSSGGRFHLFKDKRFYIGASILLAGVLINQASSIFLKNNYHDLPVLQDLILDNLPLFNLAWVYDLFASISVFLFIGYIFFKKMEYIPYYLVLLGVLQLIRGFFIILTPFANPVNTYNQIMDTTVFRSGVYPSGHTGTSFIIFLLSDGRWKLIFFILSLGVVVFLLLAKGHYSIDIFSALLFAYAVYLFGEKYLKEKFVLKC